MAEDVRKDYGDALFQERVALMKSYITGGVRTHELSYTLLAIKLMFYCINAGGGWMICHFSNV